jgi:hypothetical protein
MPTCWRYPRTLVEQGAFYGGSRESLLDRVRLVHSTENACKNGNILNFKKSKNPSNHVAARGRELVSLVSLNKSHKID